MRVIIAEDGDQNDEGPSSLESMGCDHEAGVANNTGAYPGWDGDVSNGHYLDPYIIVETEGYNADGELGSDREYSRTIGK
jgi:hypothetical protein